jgi:hypothetical protein
MPLIGGLALWSLGIIIAKSCSLTAVAWALMPVLGQQLYTIRERLRDSAGGLASLGPVGVFGASGRLSVAESGRGIQGTRPFVVHAVGMLGRRAYRSLAGDYRSSARGGERVLVWDARLDRERFQAAQERRLAMAVHADGGSEACRAFVVGVGGDGVAQRGEVGW